MTGMEPDKVFSPRREPLTQPLYKLMNQQQLKKVLSAEISTSSAENEFTRDYPLQAHAEVIQKARELLRMPPVLPERSSRGEVIESDQQLEGYVDSKMVFTDVSEHKENKVGRYNSTWS